MQKTVSISAIGSISSLGLNQSEIWERYCDVNHYFQLETFCNQQKWVARIDTERKEIIDQIKNSDPKYKNLDDSVLMAILVSREVFGRSGWGNATNFGINIGSSRGATRLFETHHQTFLETGSLPLLTSPTTTLGNISSWVAHDLQSEGPEISHSITCSTSLHALLNGYVWLQSGLADRFLVGGSEAPLTDFTIAQMLALKIYSSENNQYPCQSLNFSKLLNTMVLGEASAMCCLEVGTNHKTLAIIEGVGFATEILEHNVSISTEANCFKKSMTMALKNTTPNKVDIVVMHAPGTKRGDESEFKAIQSVFENKLPLLTSNKWKVGHTFGASGILSLEFAVLMLQHQFFVGTPFFDKSKKMKINKIMVNAVGFGGNAVSVLISL